MSDHLIVPWLMIKGKKSRGVCRANVCQVPQDLTRDASASPIKMTLLNCRLISNKAFALNDLLIRNNLDFKFLTKTKWNM